MTTFAKATVVMLGASLYLSIFGKTKQQKIAGAVLGCIPVGVELYYHSHGSCLLDEPGSAPTS